MRRKTTARELERFRKRLRRLRRVLTGDIGQLEHDALGVDGIRRPLDNPADAGTDSFSREFSLELLARDEAALAEIDDALERLAEGTFGSCEECGEAIPAGRLEAVPYARYCVHCQRQIEGRT